MKFKLDDLPPAMRAQVLRKLGEQGNGAQRAQDAPDGGGGMAARVEASERNGGASSRGVRRPNGTEEKYNLRYLGGAGRYEAVTLRLPGGSRYTPDWMTFEGGAVTLHEVKGAYRLHSHGRARTAWREAVAAFPCFRFVWASLKSNGEWEVEDAGVP